MDDVDKVDDMDDMDNMDSVDPQQMYYFGRRKGVQEGAQSEIFLLLRQCLADSLGEGAEKNRFAQ